MGIFKGRYRADIEGDFVVFLIGTRPSLRHPLETLFVFRQMPKMIAELEADPDSGLLGANQGFFYGGPAIVQFWRSFEHLDRYARDPNAKHLPAWREFNQRIRNSGHVGIWHETYKIRAGEYESIYGNM